MWTIKENKIPQKYMRLKSMRMSSAGKRGNISLIQQASKHTSRAKSVDTVQETSHVLD